MSSSSRRQSRRSFVASSGPPSSSVNTSPAIDATDPASGPRLSFQKVPESKTVKNRLHLDLRSDRFGAESQRLIGLGATPIRDFEKPAIRWTTFADPEGNEFDLIAAQPPASGSSELNPQPLRASPAAGLRSGLAH